MAGHRYVTASGEDPQENHWVSSLLVVGSVIVGTTALYYWFNGRRQIQTPATAGYNHNQPQQHYAQIRHRYDL